MSNGVYGADCAGVIKIGGRYFCRFCKGGRIRMAWSLAGANLYLHASEIDKDLAKIKNKYPKAVLGEVRLIAEQVAL